jgi:integrative and conjugative element protein (TIGR02256 family)
VFDFQYYSISAEAITLILDESVSKAPFETGGVLMGKYDGEVIVIEVATGPGPKAKHSLHSFQRDGDYSQEHLDRFVRETGGMWDYLGEWHSHPQKAGPSQYDLSAIKKIRHNKKYLIQFPILGLHVFEDGFWKFYCFSIKRNKLYRLILKE